MESQGILLEATKGDLMVDERDEAGRLEKAAAVEKEERSARAKAAAQKGKGKATKATPREG